MNTPLCLSKPKSQPWLLWRCLLIVAASCCSWVCVNAATVVCGLVENQTWTPAGSPYLVTCDVQVDSLFIHPGVAVQLQSNYVIQVTGFLVATGTVAQPILFSTTNATDGWQGIFFNEVLPLSELDHCVIEGSQNSGVRIKNCIVEIQNCVFRNNSALEGGAINIDNAQAGLGESRVSNCLFTNNTAVAHGGAVRANLGSNSIQFVRCTVRNNAANPGAAGGNYLGGGLYISGSSASFYNCVFGGNSVSSCAGFVQTRYSLGGAVFVDGSAAVSFKNCVLTNNNALAFNCGSPSSPIGQGGAFYQDNGTLSMINCIVAFNTSNTDGSGIFMPSGTALVQNCTIAHNSNIGFRAADDSSLVRNSILYSNFGGGLQIFGTTNIFYSNVQNGSTNNNNIAVQPSLGPCSNLRITFSSPCKDKGDPNPIYNDVCIDDLTSCSDFSRGTSRNDMGAHGGPGACCWPAPCQGILLEGPQSAAHCYGQNATFCVAASGAEPFSYQWYFNGATINGATNACYTLLNVQSNNAGAYSVRVCNPIECKTNSANLLAYPACIDIHLYAGLAITGQTGNYCLQYVNDIESTNWTTVTNFNLAGPEFFYLDRQSPFLPRRFYRVVDGPCP